MIYGTMRPHMIWFPSKTMENGLLLQDGQINKIVIMELDLFEEMNTIAQIPVQYTMIDDAYIKILNGADLKMMPSLAKESDDGINGISRD